MFAVRRSLSRGVIAVAVASAHAASCTFPIGVAYNSPLSSCGNPVCNDQLSAFQMARESMNKAKSQPISQDPGADAKAMVAENVVDGCPLGRKELGEKTWSLIHTIAAYYPDNPSEEQQLAATQLINAIALLYPCKHCAEDFRGNVELSPPNVSSGESFSLWICEQHNIVNEKLEKEKFPCDLEKLKERWLTGKPACWLSNNISLKDENDSQEDE